MKQRGKTQTLSAAYFLLSILEDKDASGGHCQAREALIQFVSFVRQVNKSSCKVVGAIQDVSVTSPGSFDAHPTAYEKDVGISSSFCLNSV